MKQNKIKESELHQIVENVVRHTLGEGYKPYILHYKMFGQGWEQTFIDNPLKIRSIADKFQYWDVTTGDNTSEVDNLVAWGGKGGYWYNMLNNPKTPHRVKQAIVAKQKNWAPLNEEENNNYYYRVSAKEDNGFPTYTKSIVAVKQLEDIIRGNGYTPTVQKLTKMQIPMSEIELINDLDDLKENKDIKKNVVKINESQLRSIIAESIKKVLKEKGGNEWAENE